MLYNEATSYSSLIFFFKFWNWIFPNIPGWPWICDSSTLASRVAEKTDRPTSPDPSTFLLTERITRSQRCCGRLLVKKWNSAGSEKHTQRKLNRPTVSQKECSFVTKPNPNSKVWSRAGGSHLYSQHLGGEGRGISVSPGLAEMYTVSSCTAWAAMWDISSNN